MSATGPLSPIDPGKRMGSVDAVRGFALFGVLLVNMYNFGADSAEWTESLDRMTNTVVHAVFETKSWRLFSLLFGFGFALQLTRIMSDPGGSVWVYVRRMVILFGFGMLHALFFDGDILMAYAMLGLILVPFRNVGRRKLLILAAVLLAAFPLGNLVYTQTEIDLEDQWEDSMSLSEQRVDHPYLDSLTEVFSENVAVIPPRIWEDLHSPESSLAIFAMLLLGLWVGRSAILNDIEGHLPLLRRVFAWGIFIGAGSALIEWSLKQNFDYAVFGETSAPRGVRLLGDVLFVYGSTALALAYAAGIVLLTRKSSFHGVLQLFQNMGRMALTVYLTGTLMFTFLFYGYGFGQLFLLGPVKTSLYAILFFAIQMAFCSWWLGRFRFGPAEWLWRSMTYLRLQPLQLKPVGENNGV